MELSETWKSTWPVSAVFPAPNLLSGPSAKPFGPLFFSPSSPPLNLFSSTSLALPLRCRPGTSALRDGLRVFLRDSGEPFIPNSTFNDLSAAVLSDDTENDPVDTNRLHVLRCRDGSNFVLFFPTGNNADEVGYLYLSVMGTEPVIVASNDGSVFRQSEGLEHPHHRITGMATVTADPPDLEWGNSGNSAAEGYLLVTTLYSVSWFRVEIVVLGSKSSRVRPCLVSIGRRSFANRVVHACWNPHFQQESVVLLENGDLYWIKVNLQRGVRIRAPVGDPTRWLSCQFGALPWILFVANSDAVVTVDLRSKNGSNRTVLAKTEETSSYSVVHSMENDPFIAFCRADFDEFHFSVVTKHHLLLFDTRQPVVPILKWNHGLSHPSYISMHQLSELRPSKEFKWASELGFAILVGSFFADSEFSLFCCGPKAEGDPYKYMFYAWELPSALCLLDRLCKSVDDLLKEEFQKEAFPHVTEWQRQRDVVVGLFILPESSSPTASESEEDTGGFISFQLLSSGKLECQRYFASWNIFLRDSPNCKLETSSAGPTFPCLFSDQDDQLATRHDFINFNFLSAYLDGNISDALNSEVTQIGSGYLEPKQWYSNGELFDIIGKGLCRSSPSVSDCLMDVSNPMSIYEIASQRELYSLPTHILSLAFSKYSELFNNPMETSFELLEACRSLPYKHLPQIFVRKPSGRSERWSHKTPPTDCLVGPVLPLPVLLSLKQIEHKDYASCLDQTSKSDYLLPQCQAILKEVFIEVSIAADNSGECFPSQELSDEKPFFVHEPRSYHLESSQTTIKDDKFSIFVAGILDKSDSKSSVQDTRSVEMFNDLTAVRLDFDLSHIEFSQNEHKIFSGLKRQFSKWQTSQGFQ